MPSLTEYITTAKAFNRHIALNESLLLNETQHHYNHYFYSTLGSQHLIRLTTEDHNVLSLPLFHIEKYATIICSIIAGANIKERINLINTLLIQLKLTKKILRQNRHLKDYSVE